MATSTIQITVPHDIQTVWDIVTSVEGYTWRSDLKKTERLNDIQFIEYTNEGYATTFTITASKPYERWEFDMENKTIKGHWIGLFTQNGKQTELTLTEDVTAKRFFMKPFVKAYLKKQQTQFISDLKKALLS